MLDDPLKYALLSGLAIALLIAAFTDFRSRRIGNWLNGAIALGAPLFWWASGLSLWPEIAMQIALAAGTFAILAVLFALRAMGGGDVKLLSALALWVPPALFLNMVIIMALLGGVLTILFSVWHIARRRKERLAIPYGVAIAMAGLWILCTAYLPAAANVTSAGTHFLTING